MSTNPDKTGNALSCVEAVSPSAASQNDTFRFLDLPTDIRCVFYDNFFPSIIIDIRPENRLGQTGDIVVDVQAPARHITALPFVCKKVYGETRRHLVRRFKLQITGFPTYYVNSRVLTESLKGCLSNFTLQNIRHLSNLQLGRCGPIFSVSHFIELLPALRVCLASPKKFLNKDIPVSVLEQCRRKGPRALFKFLYRGKPEEYLENRGIDTTAKRPEYILPFTLVLKHQYNHYHKMVC